MNKSISNMESIERFYDWMNSRQDVEIVKFQIDSKTLFNLHAQPEHLGFFHNGVIEGITSLIDNYLSASERIKEKYMLGECARDNGAISFPSDDSDAYELYRILKYQWLYESLKSDCQHAPIQMQITKQSMYRFHPGSDKMVSLYLLGKMIDRPINVFYVWYKDLDPKPFHQTLDYEKVATPQQFADMFVKFNDPRFTIIEDIVSVNDQQIDCTESHFDVFCKNVRWLFDTSKKHKCKEFLNRRHISYNDTIHHDGIVLDMHEIFQFKHEKINEVETFEFPNGLKFVKVEPWWEWQDYYWVPEADQHEL